MAAAEGMRDRADHDLQVGTLQEYLTQ